MNADHLAGQAAKLGIELGYHDINGHYHTTGQEVLETLIRQLELPTRQSGEYDAFEVVVPDAPAQLTLPYAAGSTAEITLSGESGLLPIPAVSRQADSILLTLPALAAGYYELLIHSDGLPSYRCFLIAAPQHTYRPPVFATDNRVNGITLQLYSLRSQDNWGIGDFGDLSDFMPFAGSHQLHYIGINPLHALFSSRPEHASPYSPSSRVWLNPVYLAVHRIPAFRQSPQAAKWLKSTAVKQRLKAARAAENVDYAQVWALKKEALQLAFDDFEHAEDAPLHTERQAFADFIIEKGRPLHAYALFEAIDQHFGTAAQAGWQGWPPAYQHPDSPAVHDFAAAHVSEIRFYMWLQWLCSVQLDEVQAAARRHGVDLGLYGDLAVGVARGGADTWNNRHDYCINISVGAPPDPLGPAGQNWQLPPLHPITLVRTGFRAFIELLRENMRLYGILRIDHVMALTRLWWVTSGQSAVHGTYVQYPLDALMAILALESHRNQCAVIGEDLGTVPDSMRHALDRYRVLTYSVVYFSRHADGYTAPARYPKNAITVTSTHDVAPLAGFWQGQDLADMAALGVFDGGLSLSDAQAARERDKQDLFTALQHAGCIAADAVMPDTATPELLSAVHAFGASSDSKLYAVQIENLLSIATNFNIPGINGGYPNWQRKLPINIDEMAQHQAMIQQLNLIRETAMKKNAPPAQYPQPDHNEQLTIDSFFLASHGNPFAYLGRHQVDGVGEVLRTLQPDAVAVTVLNRASGKPIADMQKIDPRGFFAVILPEGTPDYALSVQHEGLAPVRIEDPYRFTSGMQTLDAWLLGEGTHLRPYEIMGAHPSEMDGTAGVHFRVWAPNAQRVSIIGEFNHWDGRIHPMRFHQATGIWEIFIPAVAFNSLYKFEIRDACGAVRQKSDPYAFAAELRPTTASVVRGLPDKVPAPAQRAQANAIDSPISIYEVHLGSWRRNPENNFWLTYEQLASELVDYVKEMGFTHIELLPLSEYPFDGSWGYQATGLYSPTSRFGSPQQLQALIQTAHQAGISVILDWVVGHFPLDEHGLSKFDGTPLYEHADPREGYHQDWNTLIYNFGRTEVQNFLRGNALYWIERFGFDGLRVDAVASMIYRNYSRKDGEWIPNQYGGPENLEAIAFLHDTNTMLHHEAPAASCMAEESTSFANVTRDEGLAFDFKWNMGWMNDTLRYMQEDPINRKYHHNLLTFGMMYQYSENFVLPLSHDEVVHGKKSLLDRMPGDCWQKFANLRAYYGFMYGFPGKKLLFMGNEFAQGREWNYNEALDWFLLEEEGGWHQGVQQFVRDLNHTYRDHAPLYQLDQWPEGFEWLVADDGDNSVFVFERRDQAGNSLIVISNFTPVVRENYRFGVNQSGRYREVLNSDLGAYKGSNVEIREAVSEDIASHGKNQSLSLTLPPLATVYLYLEKETERPSEKAKAAKTKK